MNPFKLSREVLVAALLLGTSAAQAEPLPQVVERYEQLLLRNPQKGTAFDRVYQHFFEKEGIEKLAQRWSAKAEGEGNEAAIYNILLGMLAERQGKTKEARTFYTKATTLQPENVQAWLALGSMEAGDGKQQAAIAAFQKALLLTKAPNERLALYRQLARAEQRSLNREGALTVWRSALTEFPDDPFVLEEAAEAFTEAGQYDEAKQQYEKLRALAGVDAFKRVSAMIRIAQLEERSERIKEALRIYEEALGETSETSWLHRDVRTRIEEMYRRRDDLPGLVDYYQRWLSGHARDAEAARRLANTLTELGRKKEGIEWMEKAVAWAPDRRELQVDLARRFRDAEQPEAAVKILTALTRSFPEEVSYWQMLGDTEWELAEKTKDENLKEAAVEHWRKIAPASVKNSSAVIRLAEILAAHKLQDEALAEYERAARLAPDAPEPLERRADYLFTLKRDGEAWKVLGGLVEGKRATPENYLRLAKLQRRYRDEAAALASVEKGLKLAPENYDLLFLQWQLLTDAKRWGNALALYDRMLKAAPNLYFVEDFESRYVQALQQSGKAAERMKELSDRLPERPTEEELRLLFRLVLTARDPMQVMRMAREAERLYPNSVPLARLTVAAYAIIGNVEGEVAALQRLIRLEPKQAAEGLEQIVQAWMKPRNLEKARAAAEELIRHSPANPRGYVLYAEICFADNKREEGFAKLREAIRLGDRPTEIRLRLARAYFETGDLPNAIAVYDEAFEGESDPARRNALLKPMAEAYKAAGRIDELVKRLRSRQQADENGWRYGVLLADVYEHLHEYANAFREIEAAVVRRPADPSLLQRAAALAYRSGRQQERLKYLQTLTELDPTPEKRVALINLFLENNQGEKGLELILQWLEDYFGGNPNLPLALRTIRPHPRFPEFVKAMKQVVLQRGDNPDDQVAKAEYYMVAGEYESAKKLLWPLFENPPQSNQSPPSIPGSAMSRRGPDRMLRYYQSLRSREIARSLIPGGASHSSTWSSSVSHVYYRDIAAAYLGRIAAAERKESELFAKIRAKLPDTNERILALLVAGGFEAVAEELAQLGEEQKVERNLLHVATNELLATLQQTRQADDTVWNRWMNRFEILQKHSKQPHYDRTVLKLHYDRLKAAGRMEEARETASKLVALLDSEQHDWGSAVRTALEIDLPDKAIEYYEKALARFTAGEKAIAGSLLTVAGNEKFTIPERLHDNTAECLVEAFRSRYPSPPPAKLQHSRFAYGAGGAFVPTRFSTSPGVGHLSQIAKWANQSGFAAKVLAALDKQAATLPEDQKVYPRLYRTYFLWHGDQQAKAGEEAGKLAEDMKDDDLRLFAASILITVKEYDKALAILGHISATAGEEAQDKELLIFKAQRQAGKEDQARETAIRLSRMPIKGPAKDEVIKALVDFGLYREAEQFGGLHAAGMIQHHQYLIRQQQGEKLQALVSAKKTAEAIELARIILDDDPLTDRAQKEWHRRRAIRALRDLDALKPYLGELIQKCEQNPDDQALNHRIAEGMIEGEYTQEKVNLSARAPVWLKLTRTGSTVSGYTSPNGSNWKLVGKATLPLPETVEAGIAATGKNRTKAPVEMVLKEISPAFGEAWKQRQLGRTKQAGEVQRLEDGSLKVVGYGGDIYRKSDDFFFVSQPMQGDGEIVVSVASVNKKTPVKTGIMMRAGDARHSAYAALLLRGNDGVGFQYRREQLNAEPYLWKLTALEPDNSQYLQWLIRWLVEYDLHDKAVDVLEKQFAKKGVRSLGISSSVVEAYQETGKMPALVERFLAATPEDIAALGSSTHEVSRLYIGVCNALLEHDRANAIKVALKGLELLDQERSSFHKVLANAFVKEGNTADAVAHIDGVLYPTPRNPSPGTQPDSNWVSEAWHSSGTGMNSELVQMLKNSEYDEIWASYYQKLKAGEPKTVPGYTLLFTTLGVKNRDASMLSKIPDALANVSNFKTGEVVLATYLASELTKFPGQSALAVSVYDTLDRKMRVEREFQRMGLVPFLNNKALAESLAGEKEKTRKSLQDAAAELTSLLDDPTRQGSSYRGRFYPRDALKTLTFMAREGFAEDYVKLLAKVRTAPKDQTVGNWTMDEEGLQFEGKSGEFQALSWLLDPGDPAPKTTVVWEIRGAHRHDKKEISTITQSRARSNPAVEKQRTLTFLYGPTVDALQPIGTLNTQKAFGTWQGSIPEGKGYLRVLMKEKGPDGKPVEISSPAIRIYRGKNLIQNPDFNGLDQRPVQRGPFAIPGWKELPDGFWQNAQGGPRYDGGYVQYYTNDLVERLISGEPVPVEPGKAYFQSAWLRNMADRGYQVAFGRRYLDASGNELGITYINAYTAINWRRHWQRLVPEGMSGGETIPPGTAFIQPLLRVKGGGDWTSLFLAIDNSEPEEPQTPTAEASPEKPAAPADGKPAPNP